MGTLTKAAYLAYGESASSAGTFRYTGQRIDPETNGLYYYRARMYMPAWGRFLQTDPSGYSAGANLYAYVGNDPLNLLDPFGLDAQNPGGFGAGFAAGFWNAFSGPQQAPISQQLQSGGFMFNAGAFLGIQAGGLAGMLPFMASGGALTAGGGAARAESAATETFYRTMSQANYDTLAATGKLPATSETFISPSLEYAQQYNGVTVQFNVQAGTTNSLLGMGVKNAGLNGGAYGNLPLVQSGWGSSSAFFKLEGNVVNIGLGQGSALNTFNGNIVNFNLVPKP